MKNILLAGATGFLGNQILQELGKEDFKITAVSRTKIKNLPEKKIISSYFLLSLSNFRQNLDFLKYFINKLCVSICLE